MVLERLKKYLCDTEQMYQCAECGRQFGTYHPDGPVRCPWCSCPVVNETYERQP